MRSIRFLPLFMSCALVSSSLVADAPWARLAMFKKVEADPEKEYILAEDNGPWMIMAATFAGKGAEAQAQELVLELRRDFRLPAYLHKHRFDHRNGPATGLGVDRYGDPLKMKYLYKHSATNEECAVLVGNYATAGESQAKSDLLKIKDAEPKSLMPAELAKANKESYQQLVSFRLQQKVADESQVRRQVADMTGAIFRNPTGQYGPMGSAFLTRNPMLPKDEKPVAVVDKFVYEMNKNVKHSLLNCKGKYTVKVATFTGGVVMDQKVIKELEGGKKQLKTRLEEAAIKAHELTEALRMKNYEAYEYHDRTMSIVAVGSFDSVGSPRADGKIEINPAAFQLMQVFGAQKTPSGQQQPQSVVGIPLDVQPMLIHVPKRSFAVDYAGK